MIVQCAWCGKYIDVYACRVTGRNCCSRSCLGKMMSKKHNPDVYKWRDFSVNSKRLSAMNRALNPGRMIDSTRSKLRNAHLGTGEGKAMQKCSADTSTGLLQRKC